MKIQAGISNAGWCRSKGAARGGFQHLMAHAADPNSNLLVCFATEGNFQCRENMEKSSMAVLIMMVPRPNSNKKLKYCTKGEATLGKNSRLSGGWRGGQLRDSWGQLGDSLELQESYFELLAGEAFSWDVEGHMLFSGECKGGGAQGVHYLVNLAPHTLHHAQRQRAKAPSIPLETTRRGPLRRLRGRRPAEGPLARADIYCHLYCLLDLHYCHKNEFDGPLMRFLANVPTDPKRFVRTPLAHGLRMARSPKSTSRDPRTRACGRVYFLSIGGV